VPQSPLGPNRLRPGRRNTFAYPLGPGNLENNFQHAGGEVIFNLPIPRFDPKNETHAALSKAAAEAEEIAAAIELPAAVKFQRARGLLRTALTEAGVAKRIDDLVARLLDGQPVPEPAKPSPCAAPPR